jgi:hypothetical protein
LGFVEGWVSKGLVGQKPVRKVVIVWAGMRKPKNKK